MAERIVNSPVLVVRDGKQVEPVIGKPYDFTEAEIKEIEKLNPSAISKPVVEEAVAAKK